MYQCYLSIGIRHYRLHASELKKIFKTEPDNVISLGDVQKNIKGNIIRASMPYSNLNYIVYKWENMEIETALEGGLSYIKKNLVDNELLKKVVATDGELWCNVCAYSEKTFAMEINPEIVKEFSNLGIKIFIKHYTN